MKLSRIDVETTISLSSSEQVKSQKENGSQQKSNLVSQQVHGKLHQQLEKKIIHSNDDHLIEVIVQITPTLKKDMKKLQKIIGSSFQIDHIFTYINAFVTTLTCQQIKALSNHQEVHFIEENSTAYKNLDTANQWFGTEKAREDFQLTGENTTIAILDTGIDQQHADLDENKIIGWKDYVNGRSAPYDDEGHGTHVASIAAGSGDANIRYHGVAPNASLVGVKVLDANGSGSITQIIQGVEWMISQKDLYNIKIGNLSLGASGSSDGNDALSQAANAAVDHGIVMTVAAGNEGPERYTIGTPGAAEKAITVGSMADVGEMGYFQSLFSSRGPTLDGREKPDISAPGHRITAALANSTNGYVTYSGTSMATPFVAGTIALMLQVNPTLSPSDIKQILLNTASDWGEEAKDIDYGAGRLQGYLAIQTAGNLRGDQPTTPDHIQQEGYVRSRSRELWQYQVDSLLYPVSVTMIQADERVDFDLYIYDPSGRLVGYSYSTAREELVSFVPRTTGNYTIEVSSYQGRGSYYLDISGG